jgi:hypothetical protein
MMMWKTIRFWRKPDNLGTMSIATATRMFAMGPFDLKISALFAHG